MSENDVPQESALLQPPPPPPPPPPSPPAPVPAPATHRRQRCSSFHLKLSRRKDQNAADKNVSTSSDDKTNADNAEKPSSSTDNQCTIQNDEKCKNSIEKKEDLVASKSVNDAILHFNFDGITNTRDLLIGFEFNWERYKEILIERAKKAFDAEIAEEIIVDISKKNDLNLKIICDPAKNEQENSANLSQNTNLNVKDIDKSKNIGVEKESSTEKDIVDNHSDNASYTCSDGESNCSTTNISDNDRAINEQRSALTAKLLNVKHSELSTSKKFNKVYFGSGESENLEAIDAITNVLSLPPFDPYKLKLRRDINKKRLIPFKKFLKLTDKSCEIKIDDEKLLAFFQAEHKADYQIIDTKNVIVKHEKDMFMTFCTCECCLKHREKFVDIIIEQYKMTNMINHIFDTFLNAYSPLLKNDTAIRELERLLNSNKCYQWLACGYKLERKGLTSECTLTQYMLLVLYSLMIMDKNPSLLLQLMSFYVECIVKSYAEGFSEYIGADGSDIPAKYLLEYIIDGYTKLTNISDKIATYLVIFDKEFLNTFSLSWTLLCQRLYQHNVYNHLSDTKLNQSYLASADSDQLYKRHLKLYEKMNSIEKAWSDIWCVLNKYNLSDVEYKRRKYQQAVYSIFKTFVDDTIALSLPVCKEIKTIKELPVLEDRKIAWQKLMSYTKMKWDRKYFDAPNNLVYDIKCKKCDNMVDYHELNCLCITCSLAGGPKRPQNIEYNTCTKCTEDNIIIMKNETAQKDIELDKLDESLPKLETLNNTAQDPYHISWAVFPHYKYREPYQYDTIDEKYFCSGCENISCNLARKILNNEFDPRLSRLLAKHFQEIPKLRRDDIFDLKYVNNKVSLTNLRRRLHGLPDLAVKGYWKFVISIYGSFFVNSNTKTSLNLDFLELKEPISDIHLRVSDIVGNPNDLSFENFLKNYENFLQYQDGSDEIQRYIKKMERAQKLQQEKEAQERANKQSPYIHFKLTDIQSKIDILFKSCKPNFIELAPDDILVSAGLRQVHIPMSPSLPSSPPHSKPPLPQDCGDLYDLSEHCKDTHGGIIRKRQKKELNQPRMSETRDRLRKKLNILNARKAMEENQVGAADATTGSGPQTPPPLNTNNKNESIKQPACSPAINNTSKQTSKRDGSSEKLITKQQQQQQTSNKKSSDEDSEEELGRWVQQTLNFIEGTDKNTKKKPAQQPANDKRANKRAKQRLRKEEPKFMDQLENLREYYFHLYKKDLATKHELKIQMSNPKKDQKKINEYTTNIKKLHRAKTNAVKEMLEFIATIKQFNVNFKYAYQPTPEQIQSMLQDIENNRMGKGKKESQKKEQKEKVPSVDPIEKDIEQLHDQDHDNNYSTVDALTYPIPYQSSSSLNNSAYLYAGGMLQPNLIPNSALFSSYQPQIIPSLSPNSNGEDVSKQIVTIKRIETPNAPESKITPAMPNVTIFPKLQTSKQVVNVSVEGKVIQSASQPSQQHYLTKPIKDESDGDETGRQFKARRKLDEQGEAQHKKTKNKKGKTKTHDASTNTDMYDETFENYSNAANKQENSTLNVLKSKESVKKKDRPSTETSSIELTESICSDTRDNSVSSSKQNILKKQQIKQDIVISPPTKIVAQNKKTNVEAKTKSIVVKDSSATKKAKRKQAKIVDNGQFENNPFKSLNFDNSDVDASSMSSLQDEELISENSLTAAFKQMDIKTKVHNESNKNVNIVKENAVDEKFENKTKQQQKQKIRKSDQDDFYKWPEKKADNVFINTKTIKNKAYQQPKETHQKQQTQKKDTKFHNTNQKLKMPNNEKQSNSQHANENLKRLHNEEINQQQSQKFLQKNNAAISEKQNKKSFNSSAGSPVAATHNQPTHQRGQQQPDNLNKNNRINPNRDFIGNSLPTQTELFDVQGAFQYQNQQHEQTQHQQHHQQQQQNYQHQFDSVNQHMQNLRLSSHSQKQFAAAYTNINSSNYLNVNAPVQPSNISIMDQLNRGVDVENLALPPGITLTKVDPIKSEQLRQKSESIQKLSKPLQTETATKPTFPIIAPSTLITATPSNYYSATSHLGTTNIITDNPNSVIMFKSDTKHDVNKSPIATTTAVTSIPSAATTVSKSKRRRNKTKTISQQQILSKASDATNNRNDAENKIVTLRNPMFHGGAAGAAATMLQHQQGQLLGAGFLAPTPAASAAVPMDQPAAIIKNENGMFTIRNPALHQAVTSGLTMGGYRQFGNVNYYTPQEAAAEAARSMQQKQQQQYQHQQHTQTDQLKHHYHQQQQQIEKDEAFSYFSSNPTDINEASSSAMHNNISISCTNVSHKKNCRITERDHGVSIGVGTRENTAVQTEFNYRNSANQSTYPSTSDILTPQFQQVQTPRYLSAIGSEMKNAQQLKQKQKTATIDANTWVPYGQGLSNSNLNPSTGAIPRTSTSNLQFFNSSDCTRTHNCGDDSPPPTLTGYTSNYLDDIPNTGVVKYDDAKYLKKLITENRLTKEVSIHNVNDTHYGISNNSPDNHSVDVMPLFTNQSHSIDNYNLLEQNLNTTLTPSTTPLGGGNTISSYQQTLSENSSIKNVELPKPIPRYLDNFPDNFESGAYGFGNSSSGSITNTDICSSNNTESPSPYNFEPETTPMHDFNQILSNNSRTSHRSSPFQDDGAFNNFNLCLNPLNVTTNREEEISNVNPNTNAGEGSSSSTSGATNTTWW